VFLHTTRWAVLRRRRLFPELIAPPCFFPRSHPLRGQPGEALVPLLYDRTPFPPCRIVGFLSLVTAPLSFK